MSILLIVTGVFVLDLCLALLVGQMMSTDDDHEYVPHRPTWTPPEDRLAENVQILNEWRTK